MTVEDLPRKVRFLSRGKKENFLKLVESGQVRNPIKLDIEVYLCDDGGLYFMDREEEPAIIWRDCKEDIWENAVREGRKAFENSIISDLDLLNRIRETGRIN